MKLELDKQLGFNLYRASLLFRRELIRCLREYGITPEQWQALVHIWDKGNTTQSEIAYITLQDAPSVSRMIGRLVKNGWIKKKINPNDKREIYLSITPIGKKLESIVPKKLIENFNLFLKKFPEQDQEELLKLLIRLRISLNDFENK
ncbi:MAG TPA: MarR family transcriptional regulator [Leptospiraceae bacterium]|nr:MarR family transcriptional regulator [Leptospiraceae bacterium]HNC59735.1 MarR family transcriptional regulator [Leptospiraceae bacterium]HNH58329.1 MarR family transcriptional regulator [Leptospiraceae bacterium]HNN82381.1 MarR family transcriptional regulator [Leptospiraceae bacterium]